MERIVLLLNELIDKLNVAKNEAGELIGDYNSKRERQAIEWADIKASRQEIAKREKAVSEIESIVELEKSAKALMKKASEEMSVVEKDRDVFNDYVNKKKKELAIAEEKNAQEAKRLQKEWDVLKKAEDKLNKDKEDYREKIATGLVKLAGK